MFVLQELCWACRYQPVIYILFMHPCTGSVFVCNCKTISSSFQYAQITVKRCQSLHYSYFSYFIVRYYFDRIVIGKWVEIIFRTKCRYMRTIRYLLVFEVAELEYHLCAVDDREWFVPWPAMTAEYLVTSRNLFPWNEIC